MHHLARSLRGVMGALAMLDDLKKTYFEAVLSNFSSSPTLG